MPSHKIIVEIIKYALHLVPFLLFGFNLWMAGVTALGLAFIFYVKSFKLEVYLKDLEEKGITEGEVYLDMKNAMLRWRQFTFLEEARGRKEN